MYLLQRHVAKLIQLCFLCRAGRKLYKRRCIKIENFLILFFNFPHFALCICLYICLYTILVYIGDYIFITWPPGHRVSEHKRKWVNILPTDTLTAHQRHANA